MVQTLAVNSAMQSAQNTFCFPVHIFDDNTVFSSSEWGFKSELRKVESPAVLI